MPLVCPFIKNVLNAIKTLDFELATDQSLHLRPGDFRMVFPQLRASICADGFCGFSTRDINFSIPGGSYTPNFIERCLFWNAVKTWQKKYWKVTITNRRIANSNE